MAALGLDLNLDGIDLGGTVQNSPELIFNLRRANLSEIKINTFMNIRMERPSLCVIPVGSCSHF